MALAATIRAAVNGTLTATADLGTPTFQFNPSASLVLTDGTGAGQADRSFTDTRTLTASSSENLDLAGALTDAFGATVTFARVKAIFVTAASGNTNNVNVIREGTNGVPVFLALSDGIAVRPGGFLAFGCSDATGYPVTAGTGDLLTLTNSAGGTSVTYTIVIIGASV